LPLIDEDDKDSNEPDYNEHKQGEEDDLKNSLKIRYSYQIQLNMLR
jgi:hypothetical protein